MALTTEYVEKHVRLWKSKLDTTSYPHRKSWPSYLYHHAPIENAKAILEDGFLRSRNEIGKRLPKDVAAPGVIETRSEAHDRVRLYFRPKTPTQWNIEGIRKSGECRYGNSTHVPVLVMFVLDAISVLTLPHTMFSNQNMQLHSAVSGAGKTFFESIPFAKVFSEGGTGGDRSITDARCAEVLPSSPLSLHSCLKSIYFRSKAERDTLLFWLGDSSDYWRPFCRISDDLTMFQREYTFVTNVSLTSKGVIFRLNARKDSGLVKLSIRIQQGSKLIAEHESGVQRPHPPGPAVNWIWKKKLDNGEYRVTIKLEDCIAFDGLLTVGAILF